MPHRVLIVDDNAGMRVLAKRVIGARQDFAWVGEAASGDEAIVLFQELRPGVVLLDKDLPGMNGFLVLKGILALDPACGVVMWSGDATDEEKERAMELGARVFLDKPTTMAQLIDAFKRAVEEES